MAQKNATNTPMFSYAEVINIICRIAPNATARDIRNAIEAETQTAHDNAPQSETRETAPTASTATEPSHTNNTAPAKKQPKKKATKAELASAYTKLWAYALHNGQQQLFFEEGDAEIDVHFAPELSERKRSAISLSLRKAIETLGGQFLGVRFVIPSKSYYAAQRARKAAAK